MMNPVERVTGTHASAVEGKVKLDTRKSLWITLMLIGSILAPFHFSWSACVVFLVSSYFTLLLGHSVGMHRMMIHRSFDTPKSLKRLFIFIGVLVGMGGPSNIIKVHDTRDWAQRLPVCHDFFLINEVISKIFFGSFFVSLISKTLLF